jgi:antitoxin ParD1/3/4
LGGWLRRPARRWGWRGPRGSLSAETVAFVEGEIASGEYGTASEVVSDGLRRLIHERATREEKAVILCREVGRGLEQARTGRLSRRSVADIGATVRKRTARKAWATGNTGWPNWRTPTSKVSWTRRTGALGISSAKRYQALMLLHDLIGKRLVPGHRADQRRSFSPVKTSKAQHGHVRLTHPGRLKLRPEGDDEQHGKAWRALVER